MSLVQVLVLAIIQGVTEFLPVSSSAHLILVSYLTAWPDQGLVLDVAVHLGTLLAVIIYFRDSAYGGTGIAAGGPLFDGNSRRQSFQGIDVGLVHLPQKLPGIS